ncbi:hypothetical protein HAZT_HAZT011871 [Hyalella azteca]|uniref:BHLH domain-containing protein n=1 Tax=Hyalella azteca TaxID=294128 RepID=A0A6A0H874_HYAAZ|nr:hypothetical protein HAZT_HAZT011871 [Hyalella azteca]
MESCDGDEREDVKSSHQTSFQPMLEPMGTSINPFNPDSPGFNPCIWKSRNLSEKKRRDQFNLLIAELSALVSPSAAKKMDKSSVLRATIASFRDQKDPALRNGGDRNGGRGAGTATNERFKPSFLTNEEYTHLMLE